MTLAHNSCSWPLKTGNISKLTSHVTSRPLKHRHQLRSLHNKLFTELFMKSFSAYTSMIHQIPRNNMVAMLPSSKLSSDLLPWLHARKPAGSDVISPAFSDIKLPLAVTTGWSKSLYAPDIQSVSRLVDITAGGDFLGLCDQKISYKHVSDFGRLQSYDRLKLRGEGNDNWQ